MRLPPEERRMPPIGVRLPAGLDEWLREEAAKNYTSMGQIIIHALLQQKASSAATPEA